MGIKLLYKLSSLKENSKIVTADTHRGAVKLFICYKEEESNYIQNPVIYIYALRR